MQFLVIDHRTNASTPPRSTLLVQSARVRAASFFPGAPGRAPWAVEANQCAKAEQEYRELVEKIDIDKNVACVVALGSGYEVMATCDINHMNKLPSEELVEINNKYLDRTFYLSNVCVSPQYRRQGIGTALIKHAEHHIIAGRSSSLPPVILYVHAKADNEPAIRLYREHLRFPLVARESTQRARLRGNGSPRLLFGKEL